MNNSSEAVNGTEGSPLECPPWEQSSALRWIKTIVYLFILFLALFGNATVMWIIFKHRRMRTATNYLIVNMAVSLTNNVCHCWGVHTVSNIIVMAFSPRNIVGCLLKKKGLQRGGGGHGHPRSPLATPLLSVCCHVRFERFQCQQ